MYTVILISEEDVNVMLLLCIMHMYICIVYVNLNVYYKATGQTDVCCVCGAVLN